MVNFVITNHDRKSRVVAFALVACERQIIIDTVLNYFKILNENSSVNKAMIDKDLKEDFATQKAFPKSLYFSWHNENT